MSLCNRALILKCLLVGAVIETPLLIWFMEAKDGTSRVGVALSMLQLPGLVLMKWALEPFVSDLSSGVFYGIQSGVIFVVQSCIFGVLIFGILVLWSGRGAHPASSPTGRVGTSSFQGGTKGARHRRRDMLFSLLIGAVIEAPFFIWFSSQKNAHSEKFLLLATYHLPGLVVAMLVVVDPLKVVFSERVFEMIAGGVIFVTQSCVVAGVVFLILRRRLRK